MLLSNVSHTDMCVYLGLGPQFALNVYIIYILHICIIHMFVKTLSHHICLTSPKPLFFELVISACETSV